MVTKKTKKTKEVKKLIDKGLENLNKDEIADLAFRMVMPIVQYVGLVNHTIAYKLFRVRKNGTIGSLFINRKAILPIGEWVEAKPYKTKGFAFRPGWHCTKKPHAPHLGMEGRAWYKVEIETYTEHIRPKNQGGMWYLAHRMKILEKV